MSLAGRLRVSLRIDTLETTLCVIFMGRSAAQRKRSEVVLIPVDCGYCGEDWGRDPALEVACPTCDVDPGSKCRRPSGHPVNIGTQLHGIHRGRDEKALDVVDGYEPCPATPYDADDLDLDGVDAVEEYEQATLSGWSR